MEKKNKKKKLKRRLYKVALIISTLLCISVIIVASYWTSRPKESDLEYNKFWEYVDKGKVEYITYPVDGYTVDVKLKNDSKVYKIINPRYEDFRKELLEKDVKIKVSEETFVQALTSFVVILPIIAIYLIIVYVFGKQLLAMNMTKVFKLYSSEENTTTFDDIGGLENTKKEVMRAVGTIQKRKELKKLGCRPCKGIMLEGPPGTGKTLIAKAIAHEADVNFISCSGSDFVQMYVGLGASRVRSLWNMAKQNIPCVVFIDEIDALGGIDRGADSSNQEYNQTLEQLLQCMDGLDGSEGILVIGATNNIKSIDSALLRPGRFDKKLHVGNPDTKEDRNSVINVHLKNKKLDDNFNIEHASKLMAGLSGAEIEQSINGALEIGVWNNEDKITMKNLDESIMKVRLGGVTIKSSIEDEELSAYHEAGHAIAYRMLGLKVIKVSVIPYSSGCGGVTIGDYDLLNKNAIKSRDWFINQIKVSLGGMIAEEIVYGEHSSGCSNDLKQATNLAISMLSYFGMGDNLINSEGIPNDKLKTEYDNNILREADSLLREIKSDLKNNMSRHKDEIIRFGKELVEEKTVLDYDYNCE